MGLILIVVNSIMEDLTHSTVQDNSFIDALATIYYNHQQNLFIQFNVAKYFFNQCNPNISEQIKTVKHDSRLFMN